MGRLRTELHRTLVQPIGKWVGSAVDGFSGRGRKRRFQAREVALAAAYAERDRLQAEIQDLIQYTDAELTHLKHSNDQLRRERDALQLQVWTLEEQIEALTNDQAFEDMSEESMVLATESHEQGSHSMNPADVDHAFSQIVDSEASHHVVVEADSITDVVNALSELSNSSSSNDESPATTYPRIDLSNLRLALVGGHPTTRRGVIQELQLNYGLRHWVEVPRMNESNTNRSKVKSKIGQCTLVVLITGYMSHRLTEIIFSLKEAGSLAGDVLQLNCKGKSGVIRGILNHVEHVGG